MSAGDGAGTLPQESALPAAELAEAVQELATELERFQENTRKIIEYQASLLRVNKLMHLWMGNAQELTKHRRQMSQPSVSTLKLLRK